VPGLDSLGLGAGAYEPEWNNVPVGAIESRSLLEAAMHNFEGMAEVGPFSTLQVNANDASTLPGLSMAHFVTSCRALDLGKRYQAHLDDIFNGQQKVQVQDAWIQAHRAMLTVKAVIALMRGELSSLGYQALRQFCIEGATPRYGSQPVTVRNLAVLGMKVHGVLLLGLPAKTPKSSPTCPSMIDGRCRNSPTCSNCRPIWPGNCWMRSTAGASRACRARRPAEDEWTTA
jgi:hypothetical protein